MEHLKTPRGYAEDFDADWYLATYIKTLNQQLDSGGILPFSLDFLHDTFKSGKYHGEKLLDIGTGPTVHSIISASRNVNEIHLSDIGARNREILQKWREGDSNIPEVFEYVCKKENEGRVVEERVNMVRAKVKQVLEVDMRQSEPMKDAIGKYDIVVASLLLCAIAKNEKEFTEVLKKVMDLIKPGGYLVAIGVLDSHPRFYQVGEFRFTAPDIEGKDMKGLFVKEGLKILEWRETDPKNYEPEYRKLGQSVEGGVFGMIAQK